MVRPLLVTLLVAGPLLLVGPASVHADVAPPPPTNCPEGEVGVTDHGGAHCVKAAPDDCPPGWRGQLGGACALYPCQSDGGCYSLDDECVEYAVCLRPVREEQPGIRYEAVNLCASDVPCAPPGTCQAERLCVQRGRRAVAYRGANAAPARVHRETDAPLTESAVQPTDGPLSAISSTSRPGANGCAGCATAPAPGWAWALGGAAGVLLLIARRRRR